jgi:hypothetical protein
VIREDRAMRVAHRARQVANVLNLSTPAGIVLAAVGGAPARRARDGLIVARGYRLPIPPAPAFTVGNVVLVRRAVPPGLDPIGTIPITLLQHEERHATQYAVAGGVLMPLLYVSAAGWSWLRTGDFFSRNVFERRAGLASGGYRERPLRPPAETAAALRAIARRPAAGRSGAR